jgi:hypothetical protein
MIGASYMIAHGPGGGTRMKAVGFLRVELHISRDGLVNARVGSHLFQVGRGRRVPVPLRRKRWRAKPAYAIYSERFAY